ncbi:MAG: hypothetical protein ABIO02_03625, partial [Patescibacteria group bacterium]
MKKINIIFIVLLLSLALFSQTNFLKNVHADSSESVVCPDVNDSHSECDYSGAVGIQNAINAATPGSKVKIMRGTYFPTNKISVNKSVVIEGEGRDKTVISGSHMQAATVFVITGNSSVDVSVQDLRIEHGNAGTNGLDIRGSLVAKVYRNEFSYNGGHGIHIDTNGNASRLYIVGNVIQSNKGGGINIHSAGNAI